MTQIEPRSGVTPMLRRFDPFGDLDDVRERMARLLDETFAGPRMPTLRGTTWTPLVDVEETEDAYHFEADVPGVSPEDLTVEVDEDEIRIAGEMRERERKGVVRRRSRMSGRFEYRSTLPRPIDASAVEATLRDGVLSVRVPKSERSKPRRVEVAVGDTGSAGG